MIIKTEKIYFLPQNAPKLPQFAPKRNFNRNFAPKLPQFAPKFYEHVRTLHKNIHKNNYEYEFYYYY